MAGSANERAIDSKVLAAQGLCFGLSTDVIDQLAVCMRRQKFPPHATLMTAGQPGEAVYLILSGTVKVHVEQSSGVDVLLAVVGPGEIVGELSLLDDNRRSATVVTLDETECLWMARDTFRDAMTNIPRLALNLARLLAARIRLANEQIQALAALDVESRVARQILAFAAKYGSHLESGAILVPIRLTQSDLSNMIGASREQTNKVLVSYRQRGYLSVDGSYHFTVLKPEILAQRAIL